MNSSRYYYCPYCGRIYKNRPRQFGLTCEGCGTKNIELEMFSHDDEYYKNKSMEKYGNAFWKTEFYDLESSQNPLYDPEKVKILYHNAIEKADREFEKRNESVRNSECVPKCPTCGSTDVKKISVASKTTHAVMFGLLSKTARSQFECNNCHYKW